MTQAFVWFHDRNQNPRESIAFYEGLLGWTRGDGPPGMTMFAGPEGPFAAELGRLDEARQSLEQARAHARNPAEAGQIDERIARLGDPR